MREGTDLREAFRRLKDTDFAVSDAILQEVLARHEARRHRPI